MNCDHHLSGRQAARRFQQVGAPEECGGVEFALMRAPRLCEEQAAHAGPERRSPGHQACTRRRDTRRVSCSGLAAGAEKVPSFCPVCGAWLPILTNDFGCVDADRRSASHAARDVGQKRLGDCRGRLVAGRRPWGCRRCSSALYVPPAKHPSQAQAPNILNYGAPDDCSEAAGEGLGRRHENRCKSLSSLTNQRFLCISRIMPRSPRCVLGKVASRRVVADRNASTSVPSRPRPIRRRWLRSSAGARSRDRWKSWAQGVLWSGLQRGSQVRDVWRVRQLCTSSAFDGALWNGGRGACRLPEVSDWRCATPDRHHHDGSESLDDLGRHRHAIARVASSCPPSEGR